MRRLARLLPACAVFAWAAAQVPAGAQDANAPAATAPAAAPVSREEYERLRREVESLRRELSQTRGVQEQHARETDASLDEMDKTITQLREDAEAREGGTANFLLSGNATVSYSDRETTTPRSRSSSGRCSCGSCRTGCCSRPSRRSG